jgi:predicted Fe-Mo cluster-binding NifX family protein
MKIAIPIESESKNSKLSLKFARSPYFALVDRDNAQVEIVANPFFEDSFEVGKKLLIWLTTQHQVNTLIAFELGVKVQQKANEANMQLIIINEKKQTLKQLLLFLKIDFK